MASASIAVTSPAAGSTVAGDQPLTVTWTFSADVFSVDAVRLRYRPYGTSSFTTVTLPGTARSYTLPANTLSPYGAWELWVNGSNVAYGPRPGGGSYTNLDSPTIVVNTLGATATPTITSGASITAPSATVTWTNPNGQDQYQVLVLDGNGVVLADTGVQVSTNTSVDMPFPTTGVTREVRVATRRGPTYAMSPYATKTVTVAYTLPSAGVVSSVAVLDRYGLGCKHAVNVTVTIPAGSPVTIARWELLCRVAGTTGPGVVVVSEPGGAGTYGRQYDTGSHGRVYQFAVRTTTADGRSTTGAWVSAPEVVTMRGAVVLDVANPAGVRAFLLNGEGGKETVQPSSALLEYDGRSLPVAEFGTMGARSVAVDELNLRTGAERDAFLLLANLRGLVLYRDARGRKVYGVLSAGTVEDTFYGTKTALTMTAVDYPGDRTP